MEHWQFLIQKQGDRSWHPLESPNVDILEGRYRVVARSNLPNTDVEVRITHSSTVDIPPKRRVHKRSRRTNADGLMAVIPFTYLKPGICDLQCSGDLMSDILGKSWQYSVQLKILPQATDERMGEWRDEENSPVFLSEDKLVSTTSVNSALVKQSKGSAEEAIIDQPVRPVWLKGETAEQILQHLVELAIPASEPILEEETVEDAPTVIPELPLLLNLDEEIYVARWGQTLTVNGRVLLKDTTNLDDKAVPKRICGGELRIELRSPQGLEILTQVQQPLPEKLLPFPIKCSIEIPAECESKLILGDISLSGAFTSPGEAMLLASQSFTITADVTELLALSATANKSESELQDNPTTPPTPPIDTTTEPSVKLDLELFNIVKTKKIAQPLKVHPTPKKSLPPRINPRAFRKSVASHSPQLPRFLPSNSHSITPAVSESSTQLARIEKENALAAIEKVPRMDTTFPFLRRLKAFSGNYEEVKSNASDALEFHTSEEFQQREITEIQNEDTPELVTGDAQYQDDSFNDSVAAVVVPRTSELLTAQNLYTSPLIRKWMQSQGHSLPEPIDVEYEDYDTYVPAYEEIAEEQALLPACKEISAVDVSTEQEEGGQEDKENYPPVSPSSLPLPPPPPPSYQLVSLAKKPPAWLAQEIVVDDTDNQAEIDVKSSYILQQDKQPVSDLSLSLVDSEEIMETLPTPQLYVPEGELISGKSVLLRVQLPCVSPAIGVKLWVEDCQMRRLLDGPRLFSNLLPTSSGGSEVIAQIQVPFGCLEIRLEAIALDMATQQESHKVSVVRTVMPEELPSLQLDELLGL